MTSEMAGLNHSALWRLAAEEAKTEAACMWPENRQDERKRIEFFLTVRRYKQYVTPPHRCSCP